MMLTTLAVVTIHVADLTIYAAPFVPIFTALATKLNAPAWLKMGVTAALAAGVAIVTTAIEQDTDLILAWSMLGKIALAFGIASLSYLAFRKPVTEPIARVTAGTGLGGTPQPGQPAFPAPK